MVIISFFFFITLFTILFNHACGAHKQISHGGLVCSDRDQRAHILHKHRGLMFLDKEPASQVNNNFILWHLLTSPQRKPEIYDVVRKISI